MRLKDAMFVMGMTPYDLYSETGIDQSRISYIERGYISPREDEKQKIEDVMGIKIDYHDFRRK
ncbi:MAG: helix-turn-helix transcriptional regulator [bacterium]|nr:MAG: helix-turn-helix transcriptional regulator [bacterium]